MKKVFKITLIVAILLICCATVAHAATNSDVVSYLKKSHTVAGKTVKLSDANALKVDKYFSTYPVSSENADKIIAKVDEGIALMNAAGVSDPNKLPKAQKDKLLSIAQEAAQLAGATLTFNSTDKTIDIYVNGVLFDQISTKSGNTLVQTGADYSYIVYTIAAVAVIAVASVVIYRKKAGANA